MKKNCYFFETNKYICWRSKNKQPAQIVVNLLGYRAVDFKYYDDYLINRKTLLQASDNKPKTGSKQIFKKTKIFNFYRIRKIEHI